MAKAADLYPLIPMTCKTPCANCTCKPCDYLELTDSTVFEADSTAALSSEQRKWLESPSTFLARHCALNPGAVDCKIYED